MLVKNIINTQKSNTMTALVCNGVRISYSELYVAVNSVSDGIRSMKANDNIGIFLPNSIEYVIAYFGISLSDKVIVPMAKDLKKEQFIQEVKYTELNLIITNTAYKKKIEEYLKNEDFSILVLNMDTCIVDVFNSSKFLANKNVIGGTSEDDVALLLHTSGTTSAPKKVMLTHKNLISNVKDVLKATGLTKNEKTLIILPLSLSTANIQLLQHLHIGAEIHIMDSFFLPGKVMKYISKNKITNISGVPFMVKTFLELSDRITGSDSLRYIFIGGGPLEKKTAVTYYKKYPKTKLITMYGQTEASPRITMLTGTYSSSKIGTPGKPLPNLKIRILKEGNIQCKTGEAGEITVEGPNVMKGYYKNPEASVKVLKNEILYTGDIGKVDEDGFLLIVGRKKNMILVNGKNVYPEQIEDVLCQYDGVTEAYVHGVADEIYSEQVMADIVINKKELNISQLISFCKDKLNSSQMPKNIRIVQELKKTDSYKKARNQGGT